MEHINSGNLIKRRFVICDTENLPCPGSHYLHVRKLGEGFKSNGFDVAVMRNQKELKTLTPGDVLYVSNHGVSDKTSLSVSHLPELIIAAKAGAVPIFWFWHRHIGFLNSLFQEKWILTGENVSSPNPDDSHREYLASARFAPLFIPTSFASSLTPANENDIRKVINAASFIGNSYKRWRNLVVKTFLPRSTIRYTPPFMDEKQRIEAIKKSKFALAWHSDANIQNGVIGDRVFEGLALGSVVITDNKWASTQTEGLVKFAGGPLSTLRIIFYYLAFRNRATELQLAGIEWSKKHGTYDLVARNFIRAIEAL